VLHGVNAAERPILRKTLRRRQVIEFFAKLPSTQIGMHSTVGKQRLGVITRAGDETLRRVLVLGATAVIQQVRRGRGHPSSWLVALLRRKPPKLAAVALANKTTRIAWKLMASGERYHGARAWQPFLRGRFVPTPQGSRCARRHQGAAYKHCGTPHRERDGRP
jgi:hypothetical protein